MIAPTEGGLTMPDSIELEPVTARMRTFFIHANANDSLLEVMQVMQLARIRHLPVLEQGVLVGVVSHRDVLQLLAHPGAGRTEARSSEELRRLPVSGVMHGVVYSIGPDATLGEAAQEMLCYGVGFLPIVVSTDAGSRMVGLITESDLLAAAYAPRFATAGVERSPAEPSRLEHS